MTRGWQQRVVTRVGTLVRINADNPGDATHGALMLANQEYDRINWRFPVTNQQVAAVGPPKLLPQLVPNGGELDLQGEEEDGREGGTLEAVEEQTGDDPGEASETNEGEDDEGEGDLEGEEDDASEDVLNFLDCVEPLLVKILQGQQVTVEEATQAMELLGELRAVVSDEEQEVIEDETAK